MIVLIEKRNSLKGEITVPGDKSISHRAIVLCSLAKGTSEIDGFLLSEDCISTIDCLRKMQVGIEIVSNNKIRVQGNGLRGLVQSSSSLNTGRSGTALRLILGMMSGQQFSSVITRNESAQRKPLGRIVKVLKQMGANISGRDDSNLCPLTVSPSSLKGGIFNLSSMDTHIKTPILTSALYAQGPTRVVEASKSRDHTELMLQHLGGNIEVNGLTITARGVDELYAQPIQVPGDISLAAYFITAGLIVPNSDITIKNVGINPTRTGILEVYKKMGGNISIQNERTVNNEKVADINVKTSNLKATIIEGDTIPTLLDEIPVIAVAASVAEGTTIFKNLRGYKIKESGKLKMLAIELSKMGAVIEETSDGIVVEGGKKLRGTVIESNNDYTIALSTSVAGLVAENETMVRKAQILDIIYPEYIDVLNSL
jgi:3-phosphoshikimate 1-carboxyvinyltransferase